MLRNVRVRYLLISSLKMVRDSVCSSLLEKNSSLRQKNVYFTFLERNLITTIFSASLMSFFSF